MNHSPPKKNSQIILCIIMLIIEPNENQCFLEVDYVDLKYHSSGIIVVDTLSILYIYHYGGFYNKARSHFARTYPVFSCILDD